eukprot:jgi/Tetstr1/422607/TSEL_013413.t1
MSPDDKSTPGSARPASTPSPLSCWPSAPSPRASSLGSFSSRRTFSRRVSELDGVDGGSPDGSSTCPTPFTRLQRCESNDSLDGLMFQKYHQSPAGILSERLQDVDEVVDAGIAAKFAEFCHDSENISPLEATTAIVVRYVAWIGERGHIGAKSVQPYLSAIDTFFELHNLDPIAKDSMHLTAVNREKRRAGRRGPDDLRVLLLPVSEHPRIARLLHHFIGHVQSAPLVPVALAETNFWAGTPSGWATNSDVVMDYINPNVLPSPGAWFFFGQHIAPLRHFEVQHDSAAMAFPMPPS